MALTLLSNAGMWGDLATPTPVIKLLSEGTELLHRPGNDVTLQCEFRMDQFHPFSNPLVWRKSQWLVDSVEWSIVNVMGVLQEPFWSTRRFDISFIQRPPNYILALKISSKPLSLSVLSFSFSLSICAYSAEDDSALHRWCARYSLEVEGSILSCTFKILFDNILTKYERTMSCC